MEFTKEQQAEIDNQIKEAVRSATANMYSEDEFQRQLTREVDRRVETGIQKGIETQKSKWEEEYKQSQQMTAEELAQKQLEEKLGDIEKREREIAKKDNKIQALSKLTEAEVPKNYYEKLLERVITDDAESTMSGVESLIEAYTETKTALETKYKGQMSNIDPPAGGSGGSGAITPDKFKAMSYAEQMELKKSNPDKFKQLIGK